MWRYWEVLMCFEESEGKFVVELVRVDLEEHTGDKLSEEARDHRPLEKGGADERDRDVNAYEVRNIPSRQKHGCVRRSRMNGLCPQI